MIQMPAPKGTIPPNAGKGRPRGTPNKATRDVRTFFSAFVEANAEKAQALFDRVAARDPAKALELLARLAEFVIPRLARTDLTGDAANTTPVVRVTFVSPEREARTYLKTQK
jgi:hypothetical protein